MKKKILGILLCGILIIGLTGCGNNTKDNKNSSNDSKVENITSKNYGDKYDYSVTVNGVTIDDWKIFYKDSDGIYIITSGYLNVNALGSKDDSNSIRSKANINIMGDQPKYGMYYNTDKLTYQEPNKEITDKYFKLLKLNSNDLSNKMVSEMINSSNWDNLVNKDMGAEYAIGAVPLEMFVASWNEKYSNEKLYLGTEKTGYKLGTSENPTTYKVNLKDMKGYNDELYFPTKDVIEEGTHGTIDYKIEGYHIAASSWCEDPAYDECYQTEVISETTAELKGVHYGGYGYALRPIVFIPNNNDDKKSETNNNQEKNSNDNSSIVGTYKAKESGINTNITINEDYSCYFLATSPDINYDSSCTYEYNGENITFNLNSGNKIEVTFSNDTMLWKNYIDGYDLKFYKGV